MILKKELGIIDAELLKLANDDHDFAFDGFLFEMGCYF
jgi:hypothetical protein